MHRDRPRRADVVVAPTDCRVHTRAGHDCEPIRRASTMCHTRNMQREPKMRSLHRNVLRHNVQAEQHEAFTQAHAHTHV